MGEKYFPNNIQNEIIEEDRLSYQSEKIKQNNISQSERQKEIFQIIHKKELLILNNKTLQKKKKNISFKKTTPEISKQFKVINTSAQKKTSSLKKQNVKKKVNQTAKNMESPESQQNKMSIEYDNQSQNSIYSFSGGKKYVRDSLETLDLEYICQEEIFVQQKQLFDYKYLEQIINKDNNYQQINSDYINQQPQIDKQDRAKVVNWLQYICSAYKKKRSTFHISVYCLDKLLSMVKISQNTIRMTAGCILLSISKLEEFQPLSIFDIYNALDKKYSIQSLREREYYILQKLSFQINPATHDDFLQICTQQWDNFVSIQNKCQIGTFLLKNKVYFRKNNQTCLLNYQSICLILDACLLLTDVYQHSKLSISLSIMYCYIRVFTCCSQPDDLKAWKYWDQFPNTPFENYFNEFSINCLGIKLNSILNSIRYVSQFFTRQLSLQIVFNENGQTHEDVLSFQFQKEETLKVVLGLNINQCSKYFI